MARFFISYRRRDSAYVAIDVRDALQARFGTDSVFFDVDNIPFGADFRKYIGNAVGQCDVLLVLIGDQWLQSTDDQGKRRIDDPSDYVRIEIESALKRDIPVIPVLVGEAKVPGASELPESIRDMAFRNAAEIRATRDQKNQIERLASGLAEHIGARVSDAEGKKPAAAAREKPSALEPREAMDQSKVRESVEPKPPAAVSSAGMEKSAAPEKEKQAEPQLRETMARSKARKPTKPKLQPTESPPPRLTPSISQSYLDPRTALMENARKAFEGITNSSLWYSGAVPPAKAIAATKAYAPNVSQDAIVLLYDNTIFGGAKDGFLLTVDAIYWRTNFLDSGHCRYADIQQISVMGDSDLVINGETRFVIMGLGRQIAAAVMNLIRSLKNHPP